MSGIHPEDGSPPYRNWTSGSELNETREALLTPSSDYDDEEFLRYLWKEYLHPKEYEWALIAGYIVVFIVALIGNVLGESSSPKLPVLPSREGSARRVAGNRGEFGTPRWKGGSARPGGKFRLRGRGREPALPARTRGGGGSRAGHGQRAAGKAAGPGPCPRPRC